MTTSLFLFKEDKGANGSDEEIEKKYKRRKRRHHARWRHKESPFQFFSLSSSSAFSALHWRSTGTVVVLFSGRRANNFAVAVAIAAHFKWLPQVSRGREEEGEKGCHQVLIIAEYTTAVVAVVAVAAAADAPFDLPFPQ